MKKRGYTKPYSRSAGSHNDLSLYKLGFANVTTKQYNVKALAKYVYNNLTQWVFNPPAATHGEILVAQGRQLIDSPEYLMTGNWVQGITGAGSNDRWNRLLIPDSLYSMATEAATAAGVSSAVARAVDRDRMYVDHITCKYGFLSMSTVP